MKTIAIILAGGFGSRVEQKIPKQFIKIDKKMLLEYTLDAFQQNKLIDKIILVINPSEHISLDIIRKQYSKVYQIVIGGKTRGFSIINASNAITEKDAFIVIHDACRPFIAESVIRQGLQLLKQKELVKTVFNPQNDILLKENEVLNRNEYMILSSPDFIHLSLLKQLVSYALYGFSCVFTAALQYNPDIDFEYILSNRKNIKVTFSEDLALAALYLKENEIQKEHRENPKPLVSTFKE
ncbi:MAG: 2-C-methyl-D-erythritol 4-phosphate cytidylyltransferase [Elusimicrobiaceae bacterium]|nr:2-C-methyl-D-erythritol 4-phosphate cytidylyltransferase [Elusimicrobiaceae bacterium]